jgi:hypothetical protein
VKKKKDVHAVTVNPKDKVRSWDSDITSKL